MPRSKTSTVAPSQVGETKAGKAGALVVTYRGEKSILPPIEELLVTTNHMGEITPAQRKLLAVLATPQAMHMTNIQIAKHAGCDVVTLARAKMNPEFNTAQRDMARTKFAGGALKYANKYSEVAMSGNTGALERIMEQDKVLDPVQKNVNLQGVIINTPLSELVSLIKEEKIDNQDISDMVEVLEADGGE